MDDISELVRLRILFGKNRQSLMRLFLAGDIFGYAIPIIYVPLLMITHIAAFYMLVRPPARHASV